MAGGGRRLWPTVVAVGTGTDASPGYVSWGTSVKGPAPLAYAEGTPVVKSVSERPPKLV